MANHDYLETDLERKQALTKAKTRARVARHRARQKTQGQRSPAVELWLRDALEYFMEVRGYKDLAEWFRRRVAPNPDGLIPALPLKDKFETRSSRKEEKVLIKMTLTRYEWSRLTIGGHSVPEMLERLMLEEHELINGRLVLMDQGQPVRLREFPLWVDDTYYLRMTRNEDPVCENKHMWRRFHRERKKNANRKPFKDAYDPANKLDEANGVDDLRLATLPDYLGMWDHQDTEIHTMADGTRTSFGKLKAKEPAPPDNEHTRRELARYAEYLRSTGAPTPKVAQSYADRQKALYEEAMAERFGK